MVRDLGDAEITAMVRHHHERLDGTGYPDRLAGDAIPLGARIISVADTFDAMTSSRPYRPASKHKKALDVLAKEAGTQLDPAAVAAFLRYYSGKRSVGWTALAAAAPQRLGAWLGGVFQNAGAAIAPAAQSLAAVAAAGVIGAGLGGGAEPTSAEVARNQPGHAAEAAGPSRPHTRENRRAANGEADRRVPGSKHDRGRRDRRGRARRGAPNGTDGPRVGDPNGGRDGGGSGGGGGSGDGDGSGGGTGAPGGGGDAPGGGGTTTPPSSGGGTDGSAPSVTPPDVELPKIKVPSVEVGPISTPKVETPPVEVPKVEVPPVEVGPITTPKIETPRVRLPGL
jgi:hypothetical protein